MMMTTKFRTLYNPSSADIWSECPYSLKLERFLGVDKALSSGAAKHGQTVHNAFADSINDVNTSQYGADIKAEVKKIVTIFEEEILSDYPNHELIVEGDKLSTSINPYKGPTINIRGRIDILFLPFDRDTGECLADNIAIYDLKTGRKQVSPFENAQLMIYADMVLRKWPQLTSLIKSFELGIIQFPYDAIKKTTITLQFLHYKLEQLYRRLVNSDADAPYSGEHCTHCNVKDWCPTAQNNLLNLLKAI